MPVGFNDVFAVGDQLLALGGESNERSAMSRHYYAAFHAAKHWLNSTPGMPSAGGAQGGSHEAVSNMLRNLDRQASVEQKKKGHKLATRLVIMKVRRCDADYDLHLPYPQSAPAQQQADAALFLQDCQSPP